jgi:hypothetical protein
VGGMKPGFAITAVAAGCHRLAGPVARRREVAGRWREGFVGSSARVRDLARYRGWSSAASGGGRREWTSASITAVDDASQRCLTFSVGSGFRGRCLHALRLLFVRWPE